MLWLNFYIIITLKAEYLSLLFIALLKNHTARYKLLYRCPPEVCGIKIVYVKLFCCGKCRFKVGESIVVRDVVSAVGNFR